MTPATPADQDPNSAPTSAPAVEETATSAPAAEQNASMTSSELTTMDDMDDDMDMDMDDEDDSADEDQGDLDAELAAQYGDAYSSEELPEPEPEPIPDPVLSFEIKSTEIPSFGSLQEARKEVFQSRRALEIFTKSVNELGDSGDEGRRRGLGLWMIAEYAEACKYLSSHGDDVVAAFTHANALMSLDRPAEAAPIFATLAAKYPGEPKPIGGHLLARMEATLAEGGDDRADRAAVQFAEDAAAAPDSVDGVAFLESAEGHHLQGRIAELQRNMQSAVDHYSRARELDPSMRPNLFRLAYTTELCGLDEVALSCYQELARMRPISKTVLMNLGLLYEDLGRDQEAATCYDIVQQNDPTDSRARLYLGHAVSGMSMYYDEDLERKEDRLNQILRIPITDFELSVRARNCLNKMNIMSLGDLVRKTEQELLTYKNFGETSLNEIKEILGSKCLRLGMAREEAVLSIESTKKRYTSGENVEAMNRPIADLELSIRARRTVEGLGCLTVGDVIQHSEDELLGMPNFGVTSLLELREKLTEFDLKLKGSN